MRIRHLVPIASLLAAATSYAEPQYSCMDSFKGVADRIVTLGQATSGGVNRPDGTPADAKYNFDTLRAPGAIPPMLLDRGSSVWGYWLATPSTPVLNAPGKDLDLTFVKMNGATAVTIFVCTFLVDWDGHSAYVKEADSWHQTMPGNQPVGVPLKHSTNYKHFAIRPNNIPSKYIQMVLFVPETGTGTAGTTISTTVGALR